MIISKREREVLLLLCQGLTSKEIAYQLYISIETVHSHRKSIQHKLYASNTAQLIANSFYSGILSVNCFEKPVVQEKEEQINCP